MRAAVIGIGRVGWKFEKTHGASHVSCYLDNPKTELVAVADVDKSKVDAFKLEYPEVETYADYEVMLNREKPEILSVAVPTSEHCRVVRNCVRFASVRGILVEKPISNTIEGAEKMIKTCKDFGVVLSINHTRRWDPAFRRIKLIVDGKEADWNIGELLTFVGRFSGDPVGDGCHMADLYNWYRKENTDIHLINVKTPYLVWDIDLVGNDGWIKVLDNGARAELLKPMESQVYRGFREPKHVADLGIEYDFSKAMLYAIDDLVECAETDKQPDCTGQDGLEALKLCLEVFK